MFCTAFFEPGILHLVDHQCQKNGHRETDGEIIQRKPDRIPQNLPEVHRTEKRNEMLEQRVCPFTAQKTLVGDKILESDLHTVHRYIGKNQEIQKCRQNKKIQHLIALHQNPVYIFTGGRPPPGHPQLNFPACLYFSLHELGRSSFACAAQPLCRRGRSRFSYIRFIYKLRGSLRAVARPERRSARRSVVFPPRFLALSSAYHPSRAG